MWGLKAYGLIMGASSGVIARVTVYDPVTAGPQVKICVYRSNFPASIESLTKTGFLCTEVMDIDDSPDSCPATAACNMPEGRPAVAVAPESGDNAAMRCMRRAIK